MKLKTAVELLWESGLDLDAQNKVRIGITLCCITPYDGAGLNPVPTVYS